MFWNSEFVNASPSHIDVLLRSEETKLSEILFEEDILQEIKTSNINLTNFLSKHKNLTELVDNITQITEEDCCDKSIYSRVHAAYVSCEILTACSSEIFEALLERPVSLNKIISCLTLDNQKVVPQKATLISKLISNLHSQAPADLSCHITQNIDTFKALIDVLVRNIDISGAYEILSTFINRTNPSELRYVFCEILSKFDLIVKLILVMTTSKHEDKQRNACQLFCDIIVIGRQEASEQANDGPTAQDMLAESLESHAFVELMLKRIFPVKIANGHCNGVSAKGSEDLASSQDEKTEPEKLSKVEDTEKEEKEEEEEEGDELDRVTERVANEVVDQLADQVAKQVAMEELGASLPLNGFDKAAEKENETDDPIPEVSSETLIVKKDDDDELSLGTESATGAPNATAILCSIKVLQTLVENKTSINNNTNINNNNNNNNNINLAQHTNSSIARTIEQIEDVLADNLINFHELLLNPPKQEPIKTTFGVIQKPLGYMRLEVVNLIRALIGTNSPKIIQTLVRLNTMKVIIDLFIEYSWNNLLHTQVERALCLIIKNCRHDEDQRDMKDLSEETGNEKATTNNNTTNTMDDIPSRALLSQLLNECDLIGRLLLPTRNAEQANFGHIIQIINSIAINCDLDTIQDHLNAMKDKRPQLYDRWTSFVNVDVASFKEISLYCDVHTLNNHVEERDKQQHHYLNSQQNHNSPHNTLSNNNGPSSNNTSENNFNARSYNGDDRELMAYLSFTRETVIPSINVDVLPKARRSTKTNNY